MSDPPSPAPLAMLAERFRQGDRRALSRLISRIENDGDAEGVLAAVGEAPRRSLKVGLTGSAGVGKSTLAGALMKHLRREGKRVALLACDPESPFSNGAVLGDRVRLDDDPADDGLFIRSLSTRGATGGVSDHSAAAALLLERFGFDAVLVETIGAGQDQMGAREFVDVLVLVVAPGGGDDIQWQKAGVLESADVFAVNKADAGDADAVAAGLRCVLGLSSDTREPIDCPVVKVSARTGEGVAALWQAIERVASAPRRRPRPAARHRLRAALQREAARRLDAIIAHDPPAADTLHAFERGELNEDEAVRRIVDRLADGPGRRVSSGDSTGG